MAFFFLHQILLVSFIPRCCDFLVLLVKWSSPRLKSPYWKQCLRGWLPTKNAKNDMTLFTNLKMQYLGNMGRAALFMSGSRRRLQLRAVLLMTITQVRQGLETGTFAAALILEQNSHCKKVTFHSHKTCKFLWNVTFNKMYLINVLVKIT